MNKEKWPPPMTKAALALNADEMTGLMDSFNITMRAAKNKKYTNERFVDQITSSLLCLASLMDERGLRFTDYSTFTVSNAVDVYKPKEVIYFVDADLREPTAVDCKPCETIKEQEDGQERTS